MNFGLCRDLNLENICVVWSNNHHGSTVGAEESMNLPFLLPLCGDVGAPACSFGSVGDDRRQRVCASIAQQGERGWFLGQQRWTDAVGSRDVYGEKMISEW
jgi:hypothetical protein